MALPLARRDAPALARGEVEVEVKLEPLAVEIRRGGRPVVSGLRPWGQPFEGGDHFINLTEGVITQERRGPALPASCVEIRAADGQSVAIAGALDGGHRLELEVALPEADHVAIAFRAERGTGAGLRLGATWAGRPGEHFTGLGARHGEAFDQRGRRVVLGADRRYTGPDCPDEMLSEGGIPQGDCAPAPWLVSSAGWSLWMETWGAGTEFALSEEITASQRASAGPLSMHFLTDPPPAARLRRYLRLTGFPMLLPEWAYGHWKSRDVYAHERDVVDDLRGYVENRLPLDAIVLDSPWETQYNTWRFSPHQFPDPSALIARLRRAGVRTVVWITPWVNLDSADGQRPPGIESERLHSRPATNYADGALGGHFVRDRDGRPWVGRWWMGTGSLVDFSSPAARRWWRRQAQRALDLGIGHQGRRRRGLLHAPGRPARRRAQRRRGRLGIRRAVPPHDAAGPGRVAPRHRRPLRAQRMERPAGDGDDLGRRPGVGLLVAAGAGRRHPDRGGERLLELVPRRGRLPGPPPARALPPGAAPAMGAVRLLHAADAGARPLRAGGLALRRPHPGRLPRVRPPPRAARPLHQGGGGRRRADRRADHPPAVHGRAG